MGFLELLQKRASSTFLLSYAAFWAAYHWEGIITIFFVNQDLILQKYNMLKNEYLAYYFFGIVYNGVWDWGLILWKLGGFIVPLLLAYLYVWWLPKFLINPSYKKEIDYKIQRRIIKNTAEKELTNSEREKTEASVKETEAKITLAQKQEEIDDLDPETNWKIEFDSYRNKDFLVDALSSLKEAFYSHEGYYAGTMSTDQIVFCDVNNLIKLDQLAGQLKLTEKGRFYIKLLNDILIQKEQ